MCVFLIYWDFICDLITWQFGASTPESQPVSAEQSLDSDSLDRWLLSSATGLWEVCWAVVDIWYTIVNCGHYSPRAQPLKFPGRSSIHKEKWGFLWTIFSVGFLAKTLSSLSLPRRTVALLAFTNFLWPIPFLWELIFEPAWATLYHLSQSALGHAEIIVLQYLVYPFIVAFPTHLVQ